MSTLLHGPDIMRHEASDDTILKLIKDAINFSMEI
jgi:hypothetical protein